MSELCLKDKTVVTLKDVDGVPSSIVKVNEPELLPVFLKDDCTIEKINEWFKKRSIPSKRDGLDAVLKQFGGDWAKNKNYASLSDQYWLKWRTETWKKINFFTNQYSPVVGQMFFEPWVINGRFSDANKSPDLTTNGVCRKRWIQKSDKTSCLAKAGFKEAHQEPLSEVLASVIGERLGINIVKYDLSIQGTTMCSVSDNFITIDKELVPAVDFYFKKPKGEDETVYAHLLRACERLDIPGAQEYIDEIIFFDSLTGNCDRNLSNIAFIRDSNTMKFIGPAPIFDCAAAYYETSKLRQETKSVQFADVEKDIFQKLYKKYDYNKLKDFNMEKLIKAYPNIPDKKKENLMEELNKQRGRLLNQKVVESMYR